jgi:sugar/nucleoside kinase (ribokinase family)
MPVTPDCWIIGPIAWDWPYRLDGLLASGGVANAQALPGRLGGTGANIARAVVSRGYRVRMVGYVGDDEWGAVSREDLATRGVDVEHVATFEAGTSQVLLFVEPGGERTIISIVQDELDRVRLAAEAVAHGDLVYFAGWRRQFEPVARELAAAGAIVASVPFPPPAEPLPVAYVVGSRGDLPAEATRDPYLAYVAWTGEAVTDVVLTIGEDGAVRYGQGGTVSFDAVDIEPVDSTGAGDSFAAALLVALLEQRPLDEGIREGLRWGAAAAVRCASVPPTWSEVVRDDAR